MKLTLPRCVMCSIRAPLDTTDSYFTATAHTTCQIETMKLFSILVGLSLLVTDLASGYVNPEKCKGICGNAHDPAIIRRDEDNTYFRFSTGRAISVYSAPDITGPWKELGDILTKGSKVDLKGKRTFWVNIIPYLRSLTSRL